MLIHEGQSLHPESLKCVLVTVVQKNNVPTVRVDSLAPELPRDSRGKVGSKKHA